MLFRMDSTCVGDSCPRTMIESHTAPKYAVLCTGERTSWHWVSTPRIRNDLGQHPCVEALAPETEPKSASRLLNLKCGCPGVAEESEPCILCMFGVTRLGRMEELNTGKLCPQKQTSGASSVVVKKIYVNYASLGSFATNQSPGWIWDTIILIVSILNLHVLS